MDTIVDLFEVCRQARTLEGVAPLAGFERLELVERSGSLRWRAAGSRDAKGRDMLHLDIAGTVQLACQRCLEPLPVPVDLHGAYRVVRSEAEAEELPLDDDTVDPVVGTARFDLAGLVEDEVLLALPTVPRHERCPAGAVPAAGNSARPSPFAVLAALKATGGSGGGGGGGGGGGNDGNAGAGGKAGGGANN